jgi:hypothetical protein
LRYFLNDIFMSLFTYVTFAKLGYFTIVSVICNEKILISDRWIFFVEYWNYFHMVTITFGSMPCHAVVRLRIAKWTCSSGGISTDLIVKLLWTAECYCLQIIMNFEDFIKAVENARRLNKFILWDYL